MQDLEKSEGQQRHGEAEDPLFVDVNVVLRNLYQDCDMFVQQCYTVKVNTEANGINLSESSSYNSTPRKSRQLKSVEELKHILDETGDIFLQHLWYMAEILRFVVSPTSITDNIDGWVTTPGSALTGSTPPGVAASTPGGTHFHIPGMGIMLQCLNVDDLPIDKIGAFVTICEEMLTILSPFSMKYRSSIYRILNKTLLSLINTSVETMKRVVCDVIMDNINKTDLVLAPKLAQQMQRRSIFPLLGGDEGLLFAVVKHNHIHHYPFIIVTVLRCFAACSVFFPISYGRSKNKSGDDQGFITEEMLGESFINQSSLLAEFLDTLHEKLVVSKELQWERYSANIRHSVISSLVPLALMHETSLDISICARLLLRSLLHLSSTLPLAQGGDMERVNLKDNQQINRPYAEAKEYFENNKGCLLSIEDTLMANVGSDTISEYSSCLSSINEGLTMVVLSVANSICGIVGQSFEGVKLSNDVWIMINFLLKKIPNDCTILVDTAELFSVESENSSTQLILRTTLDVLTMHVANIPSFEKLYNKIDQSLQSNSLLGKRGLSDDSHVVNVAKVKKDEVTSNYAGEIAKANLMKTIPFPPNVSVPSLQVPTAPSLTSSGGPPMLTPANDLLKRLGLGFSFEQPPEPTHSVTNAANNLSKNAEDYRKMIEDLQQLSKRSLGESSAQAEANIRIGLMSVHADEIISDILQI